MSCQICDSKFEHRCPEKACPLCANSACRQCWMKYFNERRDFRCMFCPNILKYSYLSNILTKVYLQKEYRAKQSDILLAEQMHLLPQSMDAVVNERNKQNRIVQIKDEIAELTARIKQLKVEHTELQEKHIDIPQKDKQNREYTAPCPIGECRGFIQKDGQCVLCDGKVCVKCMTVMNDGHQCKADDLASQETIRKSSKTCPKCAVSIHKIDGCRQMFCTQCHVAFDYYTGVIETSIHNPHYYEWRRNNPITTIENYQCGQFPDNQQLYEHLKHAKVDTDAINKLGMFHRMVVHLRAKLAMFDIPNVDADMNKLRVKYLVGNISKDEWKRQIYLCNRRYRQKLETRPIFETMEQVATEYLTYVMQKTNIQTNAGNAINLLNKLYYDLCGELNCLREEYGNVSYMYL